MRWVLEVDESSPGYMMRKKEKREKLNTRMGRRAIVYEKRLEKGGETIWVRRCWEEIKKRRIRMKEVEEEILSGKRGIGRMGMEI